MSFLFSKDEGTLALEIIDFCCTLNSRLFKESDA
jgi:hypothetical protein